LNVNIHHEWSFCFLHINSKFETQNYENSSSNKFDFESEEIHYTTTNLMIHNFLEVQKIMDYENIIYFITRKQFHLLGLFKNKHPKEQKNSNIILWPSSIVS